MDECQSAIVQSSGHAFRSLKSRACIGLELQKMVRDFRNFVGKVHEAGPRETLWRHVETGKVYALYPKSFGLNRYFFPGMVAIFESCSAWLLMFSTCFAKALPSIHQLFSDDLPAMKGPDVMHRGAFFKIILGKMYSKGFPPLVGIKTVIRQRWVDVWRKASLPTIKAGIDSWGASAAQATGTDLLQIVEKAS